MRRRTLAIAIGLTTVCSAAALWSGVAAASSPGSAADHGTTGRTLTFDVRFSPFFVIDFSANGVRSVTDISKSSPSKGDVTVFQDELRQSGKRVGRDAGTCTITSVDLSADPPLQIACNATFVLPGGTVTTQGLASNAPVKHLVITGGTGAYLHAAGEVTLTEFNAVRGKVVFDLAR